MNDEEALKAVAQLGGLAHGFQDVIMIFATVKMMSNSPATSRA